MKKTLKIQGMMCNHCKMHVETALSEIKGIRKVVVDLKNGTAVIDSKEPVADEILKEAVKNAGYLVSEIGE